MACITSLYIVNVRLHDDFATCSLYILRITYVWFCMLGYVFTYFDCFVMYSLINDHSIPTLCYDNFYYISFIFPVISFVKERVPI